MLQIIRAILMSEEDNTKINLIFANVGSEDILLKDELDELVMKEKENGRERLQVYYVLNNPPEAWKDGVGFVTADMIKVSFLLFSGWFIGFLLICALCRNTALHLLKT